MRHCFNDTPAVFEAENENLATVLRSVADTVDESDNDFGWHNLTIAPVVNEDGTFVYRATLYVH